MNRLGEGMSRSLQRKGLRFWMKTVTGIIHSPPGAAVPAGRAGALQLLSRGYAAITALRSAAYDGPWRHRRRRLPVPVISVGNLTVGGTGKTPMVAYLAGILAAAGCRPAIVSRGYRGGLEKRGGIVSDGRRILENAAAAGDEPFMLAMQLPGVPVAVGRDRYAIGCRIATDLRPDVILLDDGFQHLRLARDVDILLADARYPLGNGYVLPRGPLREPAAAARRAHGIVFTRSEHGVSPGFLRGGAAFGGKPAFCAIHQPAVFRATGARRASDATGNLAPAPPDALRGRRLVAFAGIADNARFLESLDVLGGAVVSFSGFPDHHDYTAGQLSDLRRQVEAAGADALVTTEKDFYRLLPNAPEVCRQLTVVGVRLGFPKDADRFAGWLAGRLAEQLPALAALRLTP
ncbi:MAG: tetraacyldisaccharide 4'-kinase [Pseudomonadota bacterium]